MICISKMMRHDEAVIVGRRGAPTLPRGDTTAETRDACPSQAVDDSVRSRVPRDRTGEALPVRKRLDHRGPLSIDVSGAWYFITICAAGHKPWVATKWPGNDVVRSNVDDGRAGAPRTPPGDGMARDGHADVRRSRGDRPTANPSFDDIADVILQHAREYHQMGKWKISLFLVMPDHLHFIVHVPGDGRRGAPTLPKLVANFKHLLAARYGLRFQRDFWDTRLRDEAHYAEKFRYICNNPVRKGLCGVARNWRPLIAFGRQSGVERWHR